MITQQEYKQRRSRVLQGIGADGIAMIAAAPEILRNHERTYYYRQDSDFYYLTGLEEPEAVVVLAPGRKGGEFVLFNRVRDPGKEVWEGPRAGQEGAIKAFGADEAFPISEFENQLPGLLQGRKHVYYPTLRQPALGEQIRQGIHALFLKMRAGALWPEAFFDLDKLTHPMRLIKSPGEAEVMRKVAAISAQAHTNVMKLCRPGMMEYELEAELLREFYRHGCRAPAYDSIVASGKNACILHYITNQAKINDGDLVLVDAGGELHGYASDITRTFPANGRYTAEQRAVYELVLSVQLAILDMIKPGTLFPSTQERTIQLLTQGLVDLGILKGNVNDLIEQKAYFRFYMHRLGHWLGLDTHDNCEYTVNGKWLKLQSGMVQTVEPGLYISPHKDVDERWWNIGVRIEDDVLVTETGYENLSADVPKRIEDVEKLMAG